MRLVSIVKASLQIPVFDFILPRSTRPYCRRREGAIGRSLSFLRKHLASKRVLCLALAHASLAFSGFATCSAPKNAIEAENCLPGSPPSQWYVQGTGSPNIQGFATDISVDAGQTVFFKISTNAILWRIDIYRLGYYQG